MRSWHKVIALSCLMAMSPGAGAQESLWNTFFNSGAQAVTEGRFADGEKQLQASIKQVDAVPGQESRLRQSLKMLGTAFTKQERYAEAIPIFEKVISLDISTKGE